MQGKLPTISINAGFQNTEPVPLLFTDQLPKSPIAQFVEAVINGAESAAHDFTISVTPRRMDDRLSIDQQPQTDADKELNIVRYKIIYEWRDIKEADNAN